MNKIHTIPALHGTCKCDVDIESDGWLKYDSNGCYNHTQICKIASFYTQKPEDECNVIYSAPIAIESNDATDITAHEYIEAFRKEIDRAIENNTIPPAVCKICGNDPFLYQEWIMEFLEKWITYELKDNGDCFYGGATFERYIWIETNLITRPCSDLSVELRYMHDIVSICGNFDPDKYDVDMQLKVVEDLAENCMLFTTWKCDSKKADTLFYVLNTMEKIKHGLPLRLILIQDESDNTDNYIKTKNAIKDWSLERYTNRELFCSSFKQGFPKY